jgi:hypothetical protein
MDKTNDPQLNISGIFLYFCCMRDKGNLARRAFESKPHFNRSVVRDQMNVILVTNPLKM